MKKMYRFIQKAAILAFIGILPIALLGQKENKKSSYTPLEAPHWYVGVQGGISQFYGDITKYRILQTKTIGTLDLEDCLAANLHHSSGLEVHLPMEIIVGRKTVPVIAIYPLTT